MNKTERFNKLFKLPVVMEPYLQLLVTEQEIDLAIGLEQFPLTLLEIAEMLKVSFEEAQQLVRNAYKRDIIKQVVEGEAVKYLPGQFYANLDYLSAYETGTWKKMPGKVRREVGEWQLNEFIEMWKPKINAVVEDHTAWVRIKNRDVLLLEQALEMVEATEDICLLPCQCKTTLCPNSPVVEGSMRLGERARVTLEKGQGRRLTVDEAKAHLLDLDRAGLVHTGPRNWQKHDPTLEWVSHGNCHPSYSFPFLAGQRLGLEKKYPRAYYSGVIDWNKCSHCGICVGRCPFGAFYQDGTEIRVHGEAVRQVIFDENLCWGCGLCVTVCPETAIEMKPLN